MKSKVILSSFHSATTTERCELLAALIATLNHEEAVQVEKLASKQAHNMANHRKHVTHDQNQPNLNHITHIMQRNLNSMSIAKKSIINERIKDKEVVQKTDIKKVQEMQIKSIRQRTKSESEIVVPPKDGPSGHNASFHGSHSKQPNQKSDQNNHQFAKPVPVQKKSRKSSASAMPGIVVSSTVTTPHKNGGRDSYFTDGMGGKLSQSVPKNTNNYILKTNNSINGFNNNNGGISASPPKPTSTNYAGAMFTTPPVPKLIPRPPKHWLV